MELITMIIAPERTRIRMPSKGDERAQKKGLGAAKQMHPADPMPLEVALWHQWPLGDVACVDERCNGHALGRFEVPGQRAMGVAEVS